MDRNVLMGKAWLLTGVAFLLIAFAWRRSWDRSPGGFADRVAAAIGFMFIGVVRMLPVSLQSNVVQIPLRVTGFAVLVWWWYRQHIAPRKAG